MGRDDHRDTGGHYHRALESQYPAAPQSIQKSISHPNPVGWYILSTISSSETTVYSPCLGAPLSLFKGKRSQILQIH
jgi:hypothetical protein